MSAACLVCTAPSADAFACRSCWDLFAEDLRDLAGHQRNTDGERLVSLAVELELAVTRQERRARAAPAVSGTPTRPLPVNLHAGAVRDHLVATLCRWVRAVADARRLYPGSGSIVASAEWLLDRHADVRGYDGVDGLVADITEAVDQARAVIDSASARMYVGLCGAKIEATEHEDAFVCEAPLWADTAYAMTRCSFCDTSWPSLDRWEQYQAQVQATRLEEVRGMRLGARRLAAVLTALGHPVSESLVRKHARAGRLEIAGADHKGRKTYLAGDVLDLLLGKFKSSA